jgi:hypothetical protein
MEAYLEDKESSVEETKSPTKVKELSDDFG